MPSDQSRIIEQAKFTYSPLDKAFEKQIKAIEDQGIIKQVQALKALKSEENKQDIKSIDGIFPKQMRTNEIKNESIYTCKASIVEGEQYQSNLLKNLENLIINLVRNTKKVRIKKEILMKVQMLFMKVEN